MNKIETYAQKLEIGNMYKVDKGIREGGTGWNEGTVLAFHETRGLSPRFMSPRFNVPSFHNKNGTRGLSPRSIVLHLVSPYILNRIPYYQMCWKLDLVRRLFS